MDYAILLAALVLIMGLFMAVVHLSIVALFAASFLYLALGIRLPVFIICGIVIIALTIFQFPKGMIVGLTFTFSYIVYFKFVSLQANNAANWWFGISPDGIGTLGMILNFMVSLVVSRFTPPPPADVHNMVDNIRVRR